MKTGIPQTWLDAMPRRAMTRWLIRNCRGPLRVSDETYNTEQAIREHRAWANLFEPDKKLVLVLRRARGSLNDMPSRADRNRLKRGVARAEDVVFMSWIRK